MTMIINVKIDEELSIAVAVAAAAVATVLVAAATAVAVMAATAAATAATHFCFRIACFNVHYNRHIQIHKHYYMNQRLI